MKRYPGIGALPLGGPRRVVAIGTFDGVHVGHRAVVRFARELAAERGIASMVMTFEPHPLSVLKPEIAPAVLTIPARKAALLDELGLDELLTVPFTRSFARIRADRFAEMLCAPPIGADCVVVGAGFRFGHGGAGTVDSLRAYGRTRALTVETPATVASPDGKPVSSTRIRRLIAQGRVEEAAPLLGRNHEIEGVVVRGEARGRTIGVPTANLQFPPQLAVPAGGVYAGRGTVAGERFAAAVNIGTSPTFTHETPAPPRVEAHLLNFDGVDFYGGALELEFVARLRDEKRFASVEELLQQVRSDIERTRQLITIS
jgi:riboflavin kinase/FMN adenylyltransferase